MDILSRDHIKVAVIGGGAAGFFSALMVRHHHTASRVTIFEKTGKILSKVKVSGGGRCNVTNDSDDIEFLSRAYPRGQRFMKHALWSFNTSDIRAWFESRGVSLYAQEDGRVFPKSNNSQTIIDCFLEVAEKEKIEIQIKEELIQLSPSPAGWQLLFKNQTVPLVFDFVIICTGGANKRQAFKWLENMGHKIESPVPSLFTFNMPDESIKSLMGISVPNAYVSIPGTKLTSQGPLLITHWGMSGPAILKLSAFGARILHDTNYKFPVRVDWTGQVDQNVVFNVISKLESKFPGQTLINQKPFGLPARLWAFLLDKIELPHSKLWSELGKKGKNAIVNVLCNDVYHVHGKTTFKEEFVTCGGVSLKSIDHKTMESKTCPGIFFAGEVLDIDGITGGYNFQAAWTTAYLASQLQTKK